MDHFHQRCALNATLPCFVALVSALNVNMTANMVLGLKHFEKDAKIIIFSSPEAHSSIVTMMDAYGVRRKVTMGLLQGVDDPGNTQKGMFTFSRFVRAKFHALLRAFHGCRGDVVFVDSDVSFRRQGFLCDIAARLQVVEDGLFEQNAPCEDGSNICSGLFALRNTRKVREGVKDIARSYSPGIGDDQYHIREACAKGALNCRHHLPPDLYPTGAHLACHEGIERDASSRISCRCNNSIDYFDPFLIHYAFFIPIDKKVEIMSAHGDWRFALESSSRG